MVKVRKKLEQGIKNRGDRIRTCDLVVPNDALYQAEPHPVVKNMKLKIGNRRNVPNAALYQTEPHSVVLPIII